MIARGKIRTPFAQRLKRARVGALPFLIWVSGVFMAMELWLSGPSASTYVGFAHAAETRVSSPVDGGVKRILVDLYQAVRAGEALVVIDDADVEARTDTARAELARLAAEVDAQRATLVAQDAAERREAAARQRLAQSTAGLEYPAELRAFHGDEANLELDRLDAQLEITTSELEADRIEHRLRRAQALVHGKIGPRAEAEDLEKRLGVERARAERLKSIEAGLVEKLERARGRRAALESGYAPPTPPTPETHPVPALETRLAGWKAALAVQEKRLAELAMQRAAYVLRAPVSGRVALVQASEGQFLLAGDPILVLMDAEAQDVALWVPEATLTPPRIGDRFLVTLPVLPSPEDGAECVVRSMSPRVEVMPQRLWRDARVAEYGRVCLIGAVTGMQLAPGERVRVDPLVDTLVTKQ